ncbi:hypothetical protein HF289_10145 [Acidithiobacillus ferrooxidans]|uniref:hypothetical protein n=1 Tax=Acidithiobacillus ferrooxidans TaxID=920 RepID=UPI001C0650DE|nr:hypothetical protein [Acidithiobacillus ferrooxidans]MBU2857211.1 hypothetical protein [Acidithiobacillus ferrooxidans]
MPIIDRIIPQDAGTIEAGSTINKSQQILDEEEALAAKKKRLAEQGVAVKPNVALPAIPKADKPEKVLDADGRVKHIDHGDKIRVPFTSMVGFGKAAAARREQFVGEALDKMAERVGPDRNLKIHGNRVFMETAIKHAVAKGIPLECPDQKWQKEYERALSQTPKQKLALGVAGTVAAGGAAPLAVQATVEAPAPMVDVAESRTASLPTASPAVTAPEPVNEAPDPAKEPSPKEMTPLALQPVEDAPHESLGGIALVHDKKTGTYHLSVPDEHGHGVLVEPAISAEVVEETKRSKAVNDPALAEAMIRSMHCVPVDQKLKYSVYQFAERHGAELHTQTIAGQKPQLDGVGTPALARHWEEKVREFNTEHVKENNAHKDKLVTFPDGRQMHADNGKFYTMALDLAEHVDIEKQRQASGKLLCAYESDVSRGNTFFHLARAGKPIMVYIPTKNLEVGVDSCRVLEGKQVKLLLNKEGKLTVEDRSRNRGKEQQQKGQQI